MNLGHAVFLGIIQGITEFFPISSSGHLVIAQSLFGMKEPMLTFDIFLHFGTIISVLIFFRSDIIKMFKGDMSLFKYIIIGSIPTFIIAGLMKNSIEGFFKKPLIVGYCLILTGVFLLIASFFAIYNKSVKRERKLGFVNSIIVGIAQGISIMPGISRSGATIGTSLISGMREDAAIRFSFLLSIPAVFGANILKVKEIYGNLMNIEAVPFIAGFLCALITGILTIRVLSEILKKNLFFLFGIYCILAGAMVIARA